MMDFLKVFRAKPAEEVGCQHVWSLPKQMVVGDRVFIGRRCKLCREITEE